MRTAKDLNNRLTKNGLVEGYPFYFIKDPSDEVSLILKSTSLAGALKLFIEVNPYSKQSLDKAITTIHADFESAKKLDLVADDEFYDTFEKDLIGLLTSLKDTASY